VYLSIAAAFSKVLPQTLKILSSILVERVFYSLASCYLLYLFFFFHVSSFIFPLCARRSSAAATVTALDMSWNSDMGTEGVRALADLLRECAAPLATLDLSGRLSLCRTKELEPLCFLLSTFACCPLPFPLKAPACVMWTRADLPWPCFSPRTRPRLVTSLKRPSLTSEARP